LRAQIVQEPGEANWNNGENFRNGKKGEGTGTGVSKGAMGKKIQGYGSERGSMNVNTVTYWGKSWGLIHFQAVRRAKRG